jgi:hypothetical protein
MPTVRAVSAGILKCAGHCCLCVSLQDPSEQNSVILLSILYGWCTFCEVGTEYETAVQVSRAQVEEFVTCDKVS